MTNTPAKLTSRPARAVPSIIVAISFIAVGSVGVWLIGSRLFDGSWPAGFDIYLQSAAESAVSASWVIAAATVATVVGIVILLCAFIPGDRANRAILPDQIAGDTVIDRKDLSEYFRRELRRVDGVRTAKVKVRRRTMTVVITTPIEDASIVEGRSRDVVNNTLEQFSPISQIRPKISVNTTY